MSCFRRVVSCIDAHTLVCRVIDDSHCVRVPEFGSRKARSRSARLTAAPEERAARRARELGADVATVLAEQHIRDERDAAREHAPLAPAPGSTELDTTSLAREEVAARIVALARAAGATA